MLNRLNGSRNTLFSISKLEAGMRDTKLTACVKELEGFTTKMEDTMTDNGAKTKCKVRELFITSPITKPTKASGRVINFMATVLSLTTPQPTSIKISTSIVLMRLMTTGSTMKVDTVLFRKF